MATKARHLIFFGYSGAREPTGTKERDSSFHLVAHTMKLHLERRFPNDVVQLVCAWHKDTFINALRAPGSDPSLKIRQIHYVGHGAGGGLFFGYRNSVAVAERQFIANLLTQPPAAFFFSEGVKRRIALMWDAGLMSGFFSDALAPAKRAEIKAQLAPDALMHIWGCFAGAPTHTFDTTDAYWNLFNVGAAIDGLARHVAKTLEIETTACFDPEGIHGMDFCYRTSNGDLNCSNVRPDRLPHWLWPESPKVRWVTHDATGTANVATINFLGTRLPAKDIAPGRPPKWLTDEIPRTAANAKPVALACSAARTGI